MNEPARFRLDNSLERAGLAAQVSSAPGPAAVASPLRRATEWQGFELTLDGRPSYAKVLQEDMWPVIDPARSAEASDQAARAGAAPALLYADAEQGVLVFEALPAGEWRWARVHELLSGERLEALFSLKRAVHQGAVSGFQRSPADDIRSASAMRYSCLWTPTGSTPAWTWPGVPWPRAAGTVAAFTATAWPATSCWAPVGSLGWLISTGVARLILGMTWPQHSTSSISLRMNGGSGWKYGQDAAPSRTMPAVAYTR